MKVDIYNTDKKYKIIYADPPWRYKHKVAHGAAEDHYGVLGIEELKKIPISKIAAENSVLFLWVTYPLLKEGLELIEAWGFKYKTLAFQWVKTNKKSDSYFLGTGFWTRSNTEACLLAVRGKNKRQSAKVRQLVISPVREHSRKPDEVRERILELIGDESRIELFARQEAEGWDCFGNEI